MKIQLLIFLFVIFTNSLLANEYVIKSKGIIDVQTGKILSDQYVYIKNNKIFKIQKELIKTFKMIDMSDSFIFPGLFDCHAHIFTNLFSTDISFPSAMIRESKLPSKARISSAKKILNNYLAEGFTSVCDLGNSGHFLDAQLKAEIENNNMFPTLYISGPALASGYAQFTKDTPRNLIQKEYSLVDDSTDIENLLQIYLNKKVDILKIILNGNYENDNFNEKKLKEILNSPLSRKFKKITFHATSIASYDFISKYNIENAEHFSMFDNSKNSLQFITNTVIDTQELKKFHYYNPTLALAQKRLIKYMLERKIKPIFGPDYYFQSKDLNFNRAKEIINCIAPLETLGMSPLDILQSMTINPASSLMIQNEVSEIKAGQFADIIASKINPLENIEAYKNINFIMKNGKVILSK